MRNTISAILLSLYSVVAFSQVELKAVTYMPINKVEDSMEVFKTWAKEVEDISGGDLKVRLMGGPEVFPINNQVSAASRGLVDLVVTFTPHASIVPEVNTLALSDISPQEERENGYFELVDEAHRKINLRLLGRMASQSGFYIYSKVPIESLADFEGLKIRSHSGYDSIFKHLNSIPMSIGVGEIYSALERGIVDAAPYNFFVHDMGISEVTKYVLDNPFWFSHTTTLLMNNKKYESLTEQQREWIQQATMNVEQQIPEITARLKAENKMKLEEEGMVFTRLSDEEAEQWRRLTRDTRFTDISTRFDKDKLEKIKNLIVRD